MRLRNLAWAHLCEQKTGSLFFLSCIAVAIATVVTLYSLAQAMETDLTAALSRRGQRLLITAPSEELALSYQGVPVAAGTAAPRVTHLSGRQVLPILRGRPDVKAVAPRLVGLARAEDKEVLAAGIVLEEEQKLKPWWRLKEGKWPRQTNELLLGATVAEQLKATPGQAIRFQGAYWPVAGILAATGSVEDRLVFLDLNAAQSLLGQPDSLSLVEILVPPAHQDEAPNRLRALLPEQQVVPVKDSQTSRQQLAVSFQHYLRLLGILAFGSSFLLVLVHTMGAASARTKEMGLYRSIGYRQVQVCNVLLMEVALLSLLGGVAGYLGGSTLAALLAPGMGISFRWLWWLGPVSTSLSLAVGLSGAAFPAWRAGRLDPWEALHRP